MNTDKFMKHLLWALRPLHFIGILWGYRCISKGIIDLMDCKFSGALNLIFGVVIVVLNLFALINNIRLGKIEKENLRALRAGRGEYIIAMNPSLRYGQGTVPNAALNAVPNYYVPIARYHRIHDNSTPPNSSNQSSQSSNGMTASSVTLNELMDYWRVNADERFEQIMNTSRLQSEEMRMNIMRLFAAGTARQNGQPSLFPLFPDEVSKVKSKEEIEKEEYQKLQNKQEPFPDPINNVEV